jgi:hypothetical protein
VRRLLILLAALLLVPASPAGAQQTTTALDAAATALRSDVAIYVDTNAERASDVDIDRLRTSIQRAKSPLFVAVLPSRAAAETNGDPGALPLALGNKVRRAGTYAVVVGDRLYAASTVLDRACIV